MSVALLLCGVVVWLMCVCLLLPLFVIAVAVIGCCVLRLPILCACVRCQYSSVCFACANFDCSLVVFGRRFVCACAFACAVVSDVSRVCCA